MHAAAWHEAPVLTGQEAAARIAEHKWPLLARRWLPEDPELGHFHFTLPEALQEGVEGSVPNATTIGDDGDADQPAPRLDAKHISTAIAGRRFIVSR